MDKRFFGVVFMCLFLILLPSVMAAASWKSPATQTNHSSDISFIVTFVNITDVMDPVAANTTLYYSTDAGASWTSVSYTGFSQNGTDITGTVAISSLPSSTDLHLNLTIGNNSLVNITTFGTVGALRVDNVAPNVTGFTVQGATNTAYYDDTNDGLIYLNVSVNDNLDGVLNISSVYFNITNSAGLQNGTYTATNQTILNSSTWWSVTLNVTDFPDDTYNITAYATDIAGKINGSEVIYSIVFDGDTPTISSFSCTPTSVNVGATVTCTCTAADVSLLATTYTVNPATSSIGTHTLTCTAEDRFARSVSTTTTYAVTSGSTSSSSSTTSTWTATHSLTNTQFSEGYTKQLAAKERIKFIVSNSNHYVGVKTLDNKKATIEITSDPITLILDIGEDAKVDVDKDGIYDVYVKLNDIVSSKADVTIKKLTETVPEGEGVVTTSGDISNPESGNLPMSWIYTIVVAVIVLIVIVFVARGKK